MTGAPPIDPQVEPARGRGLIVAGAILIAVAVLGGMTAFTIVAGRIDVEGLERDVVVDGDRGQRVPGEMRFRVDQRLDGTDDETMTVAIAVDRRSASAPQCTMATSDGEPVTLAVAPFGAELLREESSYDVLSIAELRPGEYVASCRWSGEPSEAPPAVRFTVGRTLGSDDVRDLLAPMLGLLGVGAVASVLFVAGVISLIVGLVRRSRDRQGPAGPDPGWPPPQAGSTPQPWVPPIRDDLPDWPTPPGSSPRP